MYDIYSKRIAAGSDVPYSAWPLDSVDIASDGTDTTAQIWQS